MTEKYFIDFGTGRIQCDIQMTTVEVPIDAGRLRQSLNSLHQRSVTIHLENDTSGVYHPTGPVVESTLVEKDKHE